MSDEVLGQMLNAEVVLIVLIAMNLFSKIVLIFKIKKIKPCFFLSFSGFQQIKYTEFK